MSNSKTELFSETLLKQLQKTADKDLRDQVKSLTKANAALTKSNETLLDRVHKLEAKEEDDGYLRADIVDEFGTNLGAIASHVNGAVETIESIGDLSKMTIGQLFYDGLFEDTLIPSVKRLKKLQADFNKMTKNFEQYDGGY